MTSIRRYLAVTAIGLGTLLLACSTPAVNADADASTDANVDTAIDTTPSGMPITIQFRAMVADQPFSCAQVFHGLGTTHTDWRPADFRMYVHGIRLLSADGHETPVTVDEDGLWQHSGVVLLDFEDKTGTCTTGTTQTNNHIAAHVAPGTYAGIRFDVGVPFDQDHQDVSVAPSPLDVTGLFWSWEAGYKFVKIEGASTGVPTGFNIHIGSTGCVADATGHVAMPCIAPNVAEITLMGFDPTTQPITADLALLTSESNLDVNTTDTPPGCMSASMDPECVPLFAHFGLAYDTHPAPATQQFFRVP